MPCLNFGFYSVLIACLQSEINTGEKLATRFESANSFPLHGNGCLFVWSSYFCMGAYKHDAVVVIKMGVYIHGVLILCRCLLPVS